MPKKFYRPLPEGFSIKKSPIEGLGVFATKDVPKNHTIGRTHVFFKGEWVRTPLGGFYNHNSKNPTCSCETINDEKYIIALREIKVGEEITTNYKVYTPS